jgi:hypothetical protein
VASVSDDATRRGGIGQRELEMVADAMIEMFREDAPSKSLSRAAEYRQVGDGDGERFWTTLADVIRERLERPSGR